MYIICHTYTLKTYIMQIHYSAFVLHDRLYNHRQDNFCRNFPWNKFNGSPETSSMASFPMGINCEIKEMGRIFCHHPAIQTPCELIGYLYYEFDHKKYVITELILNCCMIRHWANWAKYINGGQHANWSQICIDSSNHTALLCVISYSM